MTSLDARLSYSDVRNSLGYVDDETGRRWTAASENDYVNGEWFPRVHATFDRGWPIAPGHASIWIRSAAGVSPRDPAQPFANFYFGGFGNNWVDHADEKRYRAYYSFPGADLNEISGRNFAKSTIEWNMPPWRFRRAGTPGFYLAWMRPALFAGVLATNLDAGTRANRSAFQRAFSARHDRIAGRSRRVAAGPAGGARADGVAENPSLAHR